MKCCSKCKIDKPMEMFEFRKDVNKYRNICRLCNREQSKARRITHIEVNEQKCTSCNNIKVSKEFNKNKRKKNGLNSSCRECCSTKNAKRYKKNINNIKLKTSNYYKNNKELVLKKRKKYQNNRLKKDNVFKTTRNLRNRLFYALKAKQWKKTSKFSQYIGCSKQELIEFIEQQFVNGMSWDNYGEWHIDHVVPLSLATNEEQLFKMSHYTNLKPIWAKDNLLKHNNVEYLVKSITFEEAKLLLMTHYSKRIPPIKQLFGLFCNSVLVGVVTYSSPHSKSISKAIIDTPYTDNVLELSRLVLKYNLKNEASKLIGSSLRHLPKDTIVLSYADTEQQHVGIVYQATNFGYYGTTPPKKELKCTVNDKHPKGLYDEARGQPNKIEWLKNKYGENIFWGNRSIKHRYIYVVGNNKEIISKIKYKKLPYPKKSS